MISVATHLRIARPVGDLSRTKGMYCRGLGLDVLGSFQDHQGFDGVLLGIAGASFHFEFTQCRTHPVVPAPTPEDLAVFYLPALAEWQSACAQTYEDPDGYRIVLQNAEWNHAG